jgi:predicted ATPase
MKLVSFTIKNVKSIIDSGKCYISDKDNLTILAGQNEAGKSAILEGLNFFRNGPSPEFDRLSKRFDDKGKPFVECEFLIEEQDKDTTDENLKTILSELTNITLSRGETNIDDSKEIKLSPQSLDEINSAIKKVIPKVSKPKLEGNTANEEITEVPPKEEAPGAESFIDIATKHIIENIPMFVYYDSFSDLLPGSILVKDIPDNNAVLDFQSVFRIDFAVLVSKNTQERSSTINNAIQKSTIDLNTYWKQRQTTKEDDKYQYDIQVHPNEADLTLSKIEFLIHRNDGISLFIEQKSKGFQWFSAFNLRLKALGIASNSLNKYVILIDEPGQGLHETAQYDVKAVLEELANKGTQIIYTTHNPCLIGVVDDEILRIRLVYQTREDGTKIQNIAQFSSSEGSKDALSPIITAMGISHIGQIIDSSKKCVVLEGITDHYYFTALKQILDIKDEYYFIPACGVNNIKPLISIVLAWGGIFKAVFDDGEGKRVCNDLKKYLYKNNEDLFTGQVYKMDGFDGIEDLFSALDFDTHIAGITRTNSTKNSELAKQYKKELLARRFLEKTRTESQLITLSNETKDNFKKVFSWLKK